MTLPLALALVTALAVAALLYPLLRRRFEPTQRLDHDLAIYKDQLAEIGRERDAGLISAGEARAARAEIERRILAAASSAEAATAGQVPQRRWLPTAIAVLVPAVALGIYFHIGRPELPAQPFAGRPKPPETRTADAAPMETIRRLRERIEKDPRDIEAQLALGRAQLAIGRTAEAIESFRAAQQASPERPDVLAALAEALTFDANGVVTQPARELFAAALARDARNAGARFYLGLADAQGGDAPAALKRWLDLEAESPPDAPWLEALAREIERVAKQAGIDPKSIRPDRRERQAAGSGMPQPTIDDVKRLQELPPGERDKQIRDMVDRLAERLKAAPDDVEGWRRLGRARAVLGQYGMAAEAYATADRLKPDDPEVLAPWAEARLHLDSAGGSALSPETVDVLRRLERMRPDNGLALFFLAQADEATGDTEAAIRRLRRLRELMPADAPARAAIEKRLQALEKR
jgi:cytochrome c-type biogenesis protein CcmH